MNKYKRWISIVFFGIAVNALINLLMDIAYNNEIYDQDIFEYISAILICFILIEGLRIINKKINKKIAWENQPFKRFFVQLFLNSVFTLTIAGSLGSLTTIYVSGGYINTTDLWIICSTVWVLTLIYVTFEFARYFLKEWRNSLAVVERYKKENIEFRFDRLKEQLTPHFLFNNLNTLYGLINENPKIASEYLLELSDIYRYVLQNKDNEIVKLEDEIKFAKSYVFLLSKRYGSRFNTEIDIANKFYDTHIPPLTLQLLIENAAKHNIIEKDNPLVLNIYTEKDKYVVVENNYQPKENLEKTGIGLQNLKNRYDFLSDDNLEIIQANGKFRVKIPLLSAEHIKSI